MASLASLGPPRAVGELLERARPLAGLTLGELATRQGLPVAVESRRAKGLAGQLLESALGASSGSRAEPDFAHLGIELKTLPVGAGGRPSESTFVSSLSVTEPGALRWASSSVRAKLSRVLWIPVEGEQAIPWARRRVGQPVLWSPSAAEEAQLRDDFELIAELVGDGFVERVSARLGRVLQLRPKGRDARELRWSLDAEGAAIRAPGRAFYLRPRFTGALLAQRART